MVGFTVVYTEHEWRWCDVGDSRATFRQESTTGRILGPSMCVSGRPLWSRPRA